MAMPAVLVADPERDNADTLACLLGAHGLEARVAYDGNDALRIVESQPLVGALIELSLPHASGFEVASRIRAARGRTPRLVAVTAWTEPWVRTKALEAGFDKVLCKPASPEAILETMSVEGLALLARSSQVIIRRLGLLLELGNSLLDYRGRHGTVGDPAAVDRIIEFVRLELRNVMVSDDARDHLQARLAALDQRNTETPS